MPEINEKSFNSAITKVFSLNGMSSLLSRERCDLFYKLTLRMLEENEKYNLTAITDPDKIILNHYADCATLASILKKGASIIDVGCGAGFPTLPLAIVRPDLKILAVDSTAKRINYVAETAALLGLENVPAEVMRAEDGGKNPEYRERFDYATARAVAEMRVLAELTLPFVKVGGAVLAMKGSAAREELEEAKGAVKKLGLKVEEIRDFHIDGANHSIIVLRKIAHTPAQYPRRFAKIKQSPL